jgi:hypothetical protein
MHEVSSEVACHCDFQLLHAKASDVTQNWNNVKYRKGKLTGKDDLISLLFSAYFLNELYLSTIPFLSTYRYQFAIWSSVCMSVLFWTLFFLSPSCSSFLYSYIFVTACFNCLARNSCPSHNRHYFLRAIPLRFQFPSYDEEYDHVNWFW